jgi:hypothetical protein
MKLTDGLFLDTFHEVAKEYPGIKADDIIVDDLAMKLVINPTAFDTIVLPNLQGDIISDLCAGLVGGLGECCILTILHPLFFVFVSSSCLSSLLFLPSALSLSLYCLSSL